MGAKAEAEANRRPRWELASEITLFHILPRLPAKSVVRFMTVSKQWHAFIRTPIFKNLHLHHHHHHHQTKLLLLCNRSHLYTMDCEAPEDGLTACPAPPFPTSLIQLLSSFHGLVCLGIKTPSLSLSIVYSDLIIWNPFTREHVTLSKPGDRCQLQECYKISGGAFSLYYSSSDHDYRLLRVTTDNKFYYIYSLKYDSWRELSSALGPRELLSQNWKSSVWLNEKRLYFLRALMIKLYARPPVHLISRFDTKTEKFTEIATPPCFKDDEWAGLWSFSVLRGCIHLCVGYYDSKQRSMAEIQMWRMDGDEGWMKVLTYNNIPFLSWFDEPLHMMRNGRWIMHSKIKGCFWQLQLEENIQDNRIISSMFTGNLQKLKYIQTFVSPNLFK